MQKLRARLMPCRSRECATFARLTLDGAYSYTSSMARALPLPWAWVFLRARSGCCFENEWTLRGPFDDFMSLVMMIDRGCNRRKMMWRRQSIPDLAGNNWAHRMHSLTESGTQCRSYKRRAPSPSCPPTAPRTFSGSDSRGSEALNASSSSLDVQ